MDEKFNDQIVDYLNGRLNEIDHAAFEKAVADNTDLAKEVDLYKSLYTVHQVVEDERLENIIKETTTKLEKNDFFLAIESELAAEMTSSSSIKEKSKGVVVDMNNRRFSGRRLLSMAASLLLLLVGSWWTNENYGNQGLAENNFSEQNINSFVVRNSNASDKKDPFTDGFDFLSAKNYTEASQFFQELLATNSQNSEARLYLALAQFKAKNYTTAIENIDQVINQSEIYGTKAKWLKVNILLAQGNTENEFELLLNQLVNDNTNGYYQKQAKELQKKLDSALRNFTF